MPRISILSLFMLLIPAIFAADPLVGRWQVNGGGALIDIVARAGNDGSLAMLWIDGPDLSIPEGTEIAVIYPTHTIGTYDCRASSDPVRTANARTRDINFVIKFDENTNNSVGFHTYQRKRKISLWRWIPYLFRISLINESNRPNNLEGATRVTDIPRQITI